MKYRDQDPNAIVARHIKLLHTYNETKDTTQRLIAIVSCLYANSDGKM